MKMFETVKSWFVNESYVLSFRNTDGSLNTWWYKIMESYDHDVILVFNELERRYKVTKIYKDNIWTAIKFQNKHDYLIFIMKFS